MGEIKTPFGVTTDGRTVHINSAGVVRGLACDCVCPECATLLVAVLGDIRQHHFRHNVDPAICQHAPETGLHRYAKQIICDRLELLLPHDLGRMKSARAEVWMDGIRPDVIAEYEQETIAIEIWVRHRVERNKIEIFDNRKFAALEIDLRAYRWVSRSEQELRDAILYTAPRMWLLPPLVVRLQQEQRAREKAEARQLQIEEAERQFQEAERERIKREKEFALSRDLYNAHLGLEQQADQFERITKEKERAQQIAKRKAEEQIREQERQVENARRRELERQEELENEKRLAAEEAERERTRAVRLARRRQQQQERRGPMLEDLIRAHGGYDDIRSEAWAAYDHDMKAWKTRMQFGDFASIKDDPMPPPKPFCGQCHCGAIGLYVMYDGFVATGKQIWFCQEHKPDFRKLRIEYLRSQGDTRYEIES